MAGEREDHEAGVPLPAATSIRRPPANAGVAPLNAHTRTTTAVHRLAQHLRTARRETRPAPRSARSRWGDAPLRQSAGANSFKTRSPSKPTVRSGAH